MTLNFYYIDGISRSDTLYFASEAQRSTFMNEHFVSDVGNEVFYPPYYTNTIKLLTTDIDFESSVNYLMFEYNGREYYYFIDNVTYVSETVIEITITMDTYMTYLFDAIINYCILDRVMIKRWNTSSIFNRDYLRENVSEADKVLTDYKIYTTTNKFSSHSSDATGFAGWIVCTQIDSNNDQHGKTVIDISDASHSTHTHVSGTMIIGAMPVKDFSLDSITKYTQLNTHNDYAIHKNGLFNIAEQTRTLSVSFLPFNFLRGITSNGDDCVFNIDYYDVIDFGDWGINATGMLTSIIGRAQETLDTASKLFPVDILSDTNSFDVVRNTSLATPFDKKYIPCLIDENYYEIEYGEGSATTTFPLYQMLSKYYTCHYYPDIKTGSRNYVITATTNVNYDYTGDYIIQDPQGTLVTATNPISIELINDAGKTWYAQNKLSFLQAIMGDTKKAIVGATNAMVDYSQTNRSVGRQINDILLNPKSKTPKKKALTAKSLRQLGALNEEREFAQENAAMSMLGFNSDLLDVAMEGLNARMTPDTVKSSGNYTLDISNKSIFPYLRIYTAQDIDKCAVFYHMFGNKVNRVYNNYTLVYFLNMADIRTRHYFNYIKLRETDITIPLLIPANHKADLLARLEEGIRYWSYEIGEGIQFDNVEEDLLNE